MENPDPELYAAVAGLYDVAVYLTIDQLPFNDCRDAVSLFSKYPNKLVVGKPYHTGDALWLMFLEARASQSDSKSDVECHFATCLGMPYTTTADKEAAAAVIHAVPQGYVFPRHGRLGKTRYKRSNPSTPVTRPTRQPRGGTLGAH